MDSAASLPGLKPDELQKFQGRARQDFAKSQEHFVLLFKRKYTRSESLPIWMATEIMTIGSILTFFRGCNRVIKKAVAAAFNVPDDVFESWLLALNTVRNICAHHGRVWNRIFGVKPYIPRSKHQDWHTPFTIPNDRTFAVLSICRYSIRQVAPQSSWDDKFRRLLKAYPSISVAEMGFPTNWESHAIWT